MSEIEPALDAETDRNMMIVRLTSEGRNAAYIQSQTGAPRALQRDVVEKFKHYARNDLYTQQRSREIVGFADQHFGSVIEQLYEVVSEADMNSDYKNKANTLKMIAEIEAKRIDFLQKAGVLSSQSIGDEVAQAAIVKEQIIGVLKETITKFPETRKFIESRLLELNNG